MRSKHVSLILVPLLLTACSRDNTLHQDIYNNQYDCAKDWGTQLCEPETSSSSSTYLGLYVGPQYYKNNRKVKIIRTGKPFKAYGNHRVSSKISQIRITNAKSSPIRGGFGGGGSSGGG